jgi:protein-S-isoprenylcysteine O-methyltransferase Ste14
VAGFLVGVALEIAFPVSALPLGLALAGGLLGAAVFLALNSSAITLFRRARTNVIPFRPTTAIVTSGPYRFTRNPMYVGMAALYAGFALAFGVIWALAILPAVLLFIDRYVIAREERYLERKFGEEYRGYKQRVRRWI